MTTLINLPQDTTTVYGHTNLTEQELAQLSLELKYSKRVFKQKVAKFVKAIDTDSASVWYTQYINALKNAESTKHSKFHIELLEGLRMNPSKVFNKFLVELLVMKFTSYRYIDMDALAMKVGQKCANKSYKSDTTICLSLGLNLINYFASINIIKEDKTTNKDNHTIYTVSTSIDDVILQESAKDIRAFAPMLIKPISHTPLVQGGLVLDRGLMLNKANSIVHSKQAYDTYNMLQNVAYNIRTTTQVIQAYMNHEKWYTSDLKELKGEKAKLLADLETFEGKSIYFAVGADDRGRANCKSTYITYQGDKFQKSMLTFARKHVLTQQGLEYLKINIANELYSDKIPMHKSLEWFDSMTREQLLKLAIPNPIAMMLLLDFFKAIKGEAVGTITHWDATNSGLQIYSILGRDDIGASLCNVYNTGTIADAYAKLAEAINNVLGTAHFNRDTVKKAFMVFLYGSGQKLLTSDDIEDDRYGNLLEAFPVEAREKAWEVFQTAMEAIAPSAINMMKLIYMFKTEDSKYTYTMPDGFVVDLQVMDKEAKPHKGFRLDAKGFIKQGSIRTIEPLLSNVYDKSLAPNIIHSIDAFILRMIVRRLNALGIDVSTIHDSYGVCPNYAGLLFQISREVHAEVLEMDLLEDILSQINPAKYAMAVKKGYFVKGNLTSKHILDSLYILR